VTTLADIARLAENLAKNCGFSVFPCLVDKRPATPHGFKDSVTAPDLVADLWRRHPGQLIGVATGERSGIDVLDIDAKHESARAWLITARGKIPPTRTFKTRSGGWHFLFRHAPGVRNTESLLARGVDTRGDGGYIIFWYATGAFPCVDHSPCAEWPEWLTEALFYRREPTPAPACRVHAFASNGASAHNVVEACLRKLSAAGEGSRHKALRAAACTLGGLLDVAGLSTEAAEGQLLDAVLTAGGVRVDQNNAIATIRWGLAKGASHPLNLSVH
jgi:hypothetical protein